MKPAPERSGTARSTFARLIAICVELTRTDGVSQPEVANRFEVSAKTVQRDFDFIRDQLMLPVGYNTHSRRWMLNSPQAVRKIEGIGAVFANLH